ncbi:conserved hypothetical protein [Trichinella spiralis]|uniref:hypothetical protein n=1 Tax=Trichinella spiralis TaxID=6334 RepID=UPI0001EFBA30|nr:conserved hypothetical protein [Trichinella spiralis]
MCNVHLMPEVAEEWPWAYNRAISDHRYECKVLLHNKGDLPSDTIRLMVRIIGKLDSIATALVCDNGNCDGMAIIDVAEDYYKRTEELLAKQQKWLHPLNVHRIRTLTFVGHAAYESGRTERTLLVYEELISKYE